MNSSIKFLEYVKHCEAFLELYGDTNMGVGWPTQHHAQASYLAMLDLFREDLTESISLLDFGCGASHFYEYIINQGLQNRIEYSGVDLSPKFIEVCRKKFPGNNYLVLDVLADHSSLPEFDYIIINGIFTQKLELTYEEMFDQMSAVVARLFPHARKGIAFNLMSKHVDWERSDLFHVPFDEIASFLKSSISRHFTLRHDYGLFSYTVYVYKEPHSPDCRS